MDPHALAYRGRFAPSPTGRLHFGSLVAALGSWLMARAANGRWIVRVEDLDPPREIAGADVDILETLAAFGMISDETPEYQSRRRPLYEAAFDRLKARDVVYACWCSRNDLAPFGGVHPAACVARPDASRDAAWRVRVPPCVIAFDDAIQGHVAQHLAREIGDFVVLRSDSWFAYQLAVVIDDADQHITEIVRGADLIDSTPRQILLQELLDLPRVRYAHLPLALGADGGKLSKQDAALPVDAADPLPTLRAALAFLGQHVPIERNVAATLHAAIEGFDIHRIPASAHAPAPFAAVRKELS